MTLADVAAAARERPLAVALELGSLAVCALLLVGVFAAIASGRPGASGGIWLAVVVVGAAFVCFWTVLWPSYERIRGRH